MSIAAGGLITGWAAHKPDSDGTSPYIKNTRQTVAVIVDGALQGRTLANQHNTGGVASGFDAEHGYSYQLGSEYLDGVTPHVVEVALQGGDGVFATQTGPLS
jgi:hypothetical protein